MSHKDSTDVTIVGAGDSGLLTALSVRQCNPGVDITIVDDFTRDIPEVGKSTVQNIVPLLHGFLEIDLWEFIGEVKPIWKASVYFRDWCGYEPFHFPFDNRMKFPSENEPNSLEQFYHYYEELHDSPDHRTYGEEIVEQGKSPMYYVPSQDGYDMYNHVAYHLNTNRFNQFLRDRCEERGISMVDDEITEVQLGDGSHITEIRGEHETYTSDLYIDASGFNRVLKRELESDFREFDLPLDSAYNTRLERSLSDVEPATVIETGDHGWFWQIDTFDNRDVGYVFASEFVDDGDARAEFVRHCDGAVSDDDVVKYEFDSGYYPTAWEGNCVAIGNAGGFVEPLQSTGLTANAESARRLANILSAGGDRERNRRMYNAWVTTLWDSIYDFISIHYLFGDGDTEFWNSVTSIEVSDRTDHLIEEYRNFGYSYPVNMLKHTSGSIEPVLFEPINFYLIMQSMGVESAFYEETDIHVSEDVKSSHDELYRDIADEVGRYLTTEEVYKGVLESDDTRVQSRPNAVGPDLG